VKRLVLMALVVVVASAAVLLATRGGTPGDGPVFGGTGSGETGQRLGVGEPLSFGYVLLRNRAKTSATLERIRVLGVTGGLEVLGVHTRLVPDEAGRGMFLSAFGYPPAEWSTKPLADQHVVPVGKTFLEDGDPNEGLELVIGVRATRPGVARARAVEFTYTVGGKRYREVDEGSVYLCTPTEDFTADTCPGEAHEKFDDASVEVRIP
jgi:hypothetical protein